MTAKDQTDVQKAAAAMSRARWAKIPSAKKRSEIMRAVRAAPRERNGGPPRDPNRCYCGGRNWNSAIQRRFDCCKRAGKFPTGEALEAHKRKVQATRPTR